MNEYKYQASKNTPEGWILVARSDESLLTCVEEVNEEIVKLTSIETTLGDNKRVCKTCGGEALYSEGISKKTNKPYKMIKCLANPLHVEWLH